MIKKDEAAYWITIAGLPRWGSEKVNRLIVKIIVNNNSDLITFFNLSEKEWVDSYELSEKEINDLTAVKKLLPNNSFVAENLMNQGFEVIPVISPDYSPAMKTNLKTKNSPPVIYIKGNKQILLESSIAIVGSRDASDISLKFTDNIAEKASREYKVIVSGFAKGVDRQALDSSLKYKGQSIIVLPQGILTFTSGIRQYYEQIVEGNLLVLSAFHPNLPWNSGLAMARNSIIYGLASDIYVAQSGDSGGTWEGVMSGLKAGRRIFVRYPEEGEKNSNLLLIEKGAVPVDFNGDILEEYSGSADFSGNKSPETGEEKNDEFILTELKKLFHGHLEMNIKEILEGLKISISEKELASIIENANEFEKTGKRPLKYRLRSGEDLKLNLE
jgi:DNA processing protein